MKLWEWIKKNVPKPAMVMYAIAAVSLLIHLLSICFAGFADFFSQYIAGFFRMLLAKLTSFYSFSLAEILVLMIPVIFICIIVTVVVYFKRGQDEKLNRFFAFSFALVSLFYSTFVFTYGIGYRGYTLDVKLALDKQPIETKELVAASEYLVQKVNEAALEVEFVYGGSSVMPYDFETLNDKMNDAYETCAEQYDFLNNFRSRVKPMMLSKGMSYIHMLGMYTYYTGEANINIEFPDYSQPYTVAHEMAHQRGIAREDEANFMAFLVCIASDDPYIRYSGYLNLYEYTASALVKADAQAYRGVYSQLSNEVKYELNSYQVFFSTYSESKAADVSGALNDAFLKGNGQSAGAASYGLVVDLTVAYLKDAKKIGIQ